MCKYELAMHDTIEIGASILYRIKALKDFNNVKAGDLGGYIQSESNLSQEGNCWVFDNAEVYGNARVVDNARVYNNGRISGNAKVSNDAEVYGNAVVTDNAIVKDNATIFENVIMFGASAAYGHSMVFGDAKIFGNACLDDNVKLHSDASIASSFDYCTISGFGSKARITTFFKCKDGSIKVTCGCFEGTIDEFRAKVRETHGDNEYAEGYLKVADLMEWQLSDKKEEK